MEYFDKEIVEARKMMERQKYTTLETGIYVGDELITFSKAELPDTGIYVMLPEQFVIMPNQVKRVKYPSEQSPDFIWTNLDGDVNIGFSLLTTILRDGETAAMSKKFQTALKNTNPSITIHQALNTNTVQGNEISGFEFKGYNLDGQNYNWMYLAKMRKTTVHGIFNCPLKEKELWCSIVEKIFLTVEEGI